MYAHRLGVETLRRKKALVKGDFRKIDLSDALVSGLIKNRNLRNLLKSFIDANVKDGFNINSLERGLAEYGLRLINEEAISESTTGSGKYAIDLIKKEALQEEKKLLRRIVQNLKMKIKPNRKL